MAGLRLDPGWTTYTMDQIIRLRRPRANNRQTGAPGAIARASSLRDGRERMTEPAILEAKGVAKRFGAVVALKGPT